MHPSQHAGPSAHPAAAMYMLLSDDTDRPLETRPSLRRTALLAAAATALLVGPPLYWASSADAANPIVASGAPKHGGASADGAGDDGPSGDDPDGTTRAGATTSTDGRAAGTSGPGTSAPGVTTAPGETSEGGQQTTGACPPGAAPSGGNKDAAKAASAKKENGKDDDTTAGQNTSTAPGDDTSDGGHGTNTTAGETASATGFEETQTEVGEKCPNPLEPPAITPPAPEQPTPPAPQAAPTPAPAPQPVNVLPTQVVSPAARLRAPTGCPPSSFVARVSGRAIASVTFSLDGRRLGRVTRADANGLWKTRIRTKNLSTGKHRIVARVVFTGAAAARTRVRQAGRPVTRTLSVTFVKCARAAQRPKFTG